MEKNSVTLGMLLGLSRYGSCMCRIACFSVRARNYARKPTFKAFTRILGEFNELPEAERIEYLWNAQRLAEVSQYVSDSLIPSSLEVSVSVQEDSQ